MDYPFYYNGKRAGILCVTESGIYTVFRLTAEGINEKMLRVSVYGEGREACLGLAEVREGRAEFEKKLSRRAMQELPGKIGYAAKAGEQTEERRDEKTAEGKPEETGLSWERRPDGSLFARDGISSILALPANLHGEAGRERIKVIEGRSYMLFRY